MKYGLRSLFVAVAVGAISFLVLPPLFRVETYSDLNVCTSGWPTEFKKPFIRCVAVHEPNWGRVRINCLQKIETEKQWSERESIDWVEHKWRSDAGLCFFVDGNQVVADDSVLDFYGDTISKPKSVKLDVQSVPLRDPSWPDAQRLWDQLNPPEKGGNGRLPALDAEVQSKL